MRKLIHITCWSSDVWKLLANIIKINKTPDFTPSTIATRSGKKITTAAEKNGEFNS